MTDITPLDLADKRDSDDGQPWDGHHRLAMAVTRNLDLPVEFAGKAGNDA